MTYLSGGEVMLFFKIFMFENIKLCYIWKY